MILFFKLKRKREKGELGNESFNQKTFVRAREKIEKTVRTHKKQGK